MLGGLWPFATSAQYIFDNLRVSDGLSYKTVLCIHKDREGFYWFGTTNGLNRYDGSGFKVFNQTHQNVSGLDSDFIRTISEDANGILWIGTNQGLYTFDKTRQVFKKIHFENTDKVVDISKILKDPQDKMWIFTWNQGVFTWENTKQKLILFNKFGKEMPFLNANIVLDPLHHGFWIATNKGIHFLNYKTQQLYSHTNNPQKWSFLNNHPISALTIDHRGNIWYGDLKDSLLHCRSIEGKTTRHWDVIQQNPVINLAEANKIFADSEGRIWLSTSQFKSFLLEPGKAKFQPIDYNISNPNAFGYVYFQDAYEDEQGNIWFATFNGISKWRKNHILEYVMQIPSFKAYVDVAFNSISQILRHPRMGTWIAKGDGLFHYEHEKLLARYVVSNKPEDNDMVNIIAVGEHIWCKVQGKGLVDFNIKQKKFIPIQLPFISSAERITKIFRDQSGWIWLHIFSKGIYKFNPQTNESKYYAFAGNRCMSIKEDSHQDLWFACVNGLWRYNRQENSVKKIESDCLKHIHTTQIVEDHNRHFWVATTKGVYQIDTLGKCLYAFTTQQGLGMNSVEQVAFDQTGNLWIGTHGSLGYLNPQTKVYTPFEVKTRLPFHEFWSEFSQIDKGRFIIPVFDEMLVINTDNMKRIVPLKKPLLTRLQIFETEKPFDQQQGVSLAYQQNYFTLHFSSPDHRDNAGLRYAYKLESYDQNWTKCGRRQNASYTNVPGGTYQFLVKVIDNQGYETDFTAMQIVIEPPFWATWWFYSIVIGILLCIGWWAFRRWQRSQQKKEIQQMVDYFATSRYGAQSVEEILWDITNNCISRLHFEDCVIYLLDEKRNILIQKAAYEPKNPTTFEIVNPIEIPVGEGIVGIVAQTGKAEIIADTSLDPRYISDDQVRLSELAVPILYRERVIGVIDSEHPQRNFYTTDHLNALLTIASISASRIEEVKAKAEVVEKERKLLEFNKLLAESKLMVMRAQMNPHFIFNCLNSIQECVVSERYVEAHQYLQKFSRLLRLVVQNTDRSTVPLSEEIEMLILYLELEKMRFTGGFDYAITCEEEIDPENTELPPMLLQPFVENALWHGLLPKPTDRQLTIDFRLKEEMILICSIDDNGIGRKKSAARKQQQINIHKHQSRGIQITQDRLRLLNTTPNQYAHIEMIDKEDANGEPLGTTVRIALSID